MPNTRLLIVAHAPSCNTARLSTMDCAVFDLSDTGARIKPIDIGMLPDQFELKILFGDTYQCQMIHKNGDQIGVQFV